MERQIKVDARYQYNHGYYVEVTREDSAIADMDYWLCRQGSVKKIYMFSGTRNDEHQIIAALPDAIRTFEAAV